MDNCVSNPRNEDMGKKTTAFFPMSWLGNTICGKAEKLFFFFRFSAEM